MKKTPKQIAAIIALIFIFALVICFVISAFTASNSNMFFIMFGLIIAVPILAWIILFCYGRLKGKHTMAELFPKEWQKDSEALKKNPDNADFTEEELVEAFKEVKESSQK